MAKAKINVMVFLQILTLYFYIIIVMYSLNNVLLPYCHTVHVLEGEELNKPSFCSDPDVSLHVVLCML